MGRFMSDPAQWQNGSSSDLPLFGVDLFGSLDHRPPATQFALVHACQVRDDHAHLLVISGEFVESFCR
jgi:hypothetical protein